MHDSAPIPPDPESERRGHELRDVAIKPILYFLIGLFVFGGALQAVMSAIMDGVIIPEAKVGVPSYSQMDKTREFQKDVLGSRFKDQGNARADNLQRDTTADMLEMYRKDDAVLTSYGINNETGVVHIPIDRAMKKVVEKGLLKSRPGSSKDSIPEDLPYPAHSLPYRAKY